MKYQFLKELTPQEYEDLKASIAERGVLVPVEYDEDGNILDGHHRVKVCRELGITEWPTVVRVGLSEEEKKEHALTVNSARRHITPDELRMIRSTLGKRDQIKKALLEHPEQSNRQIAEGLGVDHKTVGHWRDKMESVGEIPHLNIQTGRDGKEYPRERPPKQRYTCPDCQEILPEERWHCWRCHEHVSMEKDFCPKCNINRYGDEEEAPVRQPSPTTDEVAMTPEPPTIDTTTPVDDRPAATSKPHVAQATGNNEWYTPSWLIEVARRAMGSIDCDPASSDIANETVKAEQYYTADGDGLKQDWNGNVWLNPPYSQPLIAQFCGHLMLQLHKGHTKQACVLVNNATETTWFQLLLMGAAAVWFIKGRVKFVGPDGTESNSPLQGQCMLYFGDNVEAFCQSCISNGRVFLQGGD